MGMAYQKKQPHLAPDSGSNLCIDVPRSRYAALYSAEHPELERTVRAGREYKATRRLWSSA